MHSVSGEPPSSAIKLTERYGEHEMSVLLDGNSMDCFVKSVAAQLYPESVKDHKHFKVNIVDGKELICNQ